MKRPDNETLTLIFIIFCMFAIMLIEVYVWYRKQT